MMGWHGKALLYPLAETDNRELPEIMGRLALNAKLSQE